MAALKIGLIAIGLIAIGLIAVTDKPAGSFVFP